MIIIVGKTASGKDTVVKKLVDDYKYTKIITYATRPMRKGEQQDITYHFVTEEEFIQRINEGLFAEYKSYNTEFGTWYYGTALDDIQNADDKSVIILTPQGYRDIKDSLPEKNIICIYLYANNSTIKKRLEKRGDSNKEADRRLEKDTEDFTGFEKEADRIVYNNDGTDINDVIDKILKVIK